MTLTKTRYYEIRDRLCFSRPFRVTAAVLAADLLLLFVAMAGLGGAAGVMGQIAAQFLLALFYFHNFAITHECGHGNIHERDWVNHLVGHYTGLFCFLPFFAWKYLHNEHHSWTGNLDRDPTLERIRQMRAAQEVPWVVRLAWKSWIPVAGLLQQAVHWTYPLKAWRSGRLRGRFLLACLFSIFCSGAAYLSWALWAPPAFSFGAIWPSFVIYFAGLELVNLPHHAGMPTYSEASMRPRLRLWEQNLSTRSCRYPGRLSEILVMNFNLHTEHHFFPTLPWYRLKQARELLRTALGEGYTETVGIGWNVANRRRDPRDVILRVPDLQ